MIRVLSALLREVCEPHAALLWEAEPVAKSDYDPEWRAPLNRAIDGFGSGVPSRGGRGLSAAAGGRPG